MLLAVAAVLLIGGCSNNAPTGQPAGGAGASGSTTTQTSSPVTTTGTGPAQASQPPPAGSSTPTMTTVRDADKGKTITVKVGDEVTLTLAGTDWGFTDPKPPTVLTPMSPPIVAKEAGTSSASFRAAKPGTATVIATKASGETFQITVIVQ